MINKQLVNNLYKKVLRPNDDPILIISSSDKEKIREAILNKKKFLALPQVLIDKYSKT